MVRNFFLVSLLMGVTLSYGLIPIAEVCESLSDSCYILTLEDKSSDVARAAERSKASYNSQNSRKVRQELSKENLVVNFYATLKNGQQIPAGFVLLDQSKGTLDIAFHGTESGEDIKTDLQAFGLLAGDFSNLGMKDLGALGLEGKGHYGFVTRYQQCQEALHDVLNSLLETHPEIKNINITGHSLGGAQAQLAAADLKVRLPNLEINLITFNAPRVFDAKAAKKFEGLGVNAERVWRYLDPVSAVGPGLFGFKHVGMDYKLDAKEGLNQHGLGLMVEDAFSQKEVPFDPNHLGLVGTLESYGKHAITLGNYYKSAAVQRWETVKESASWVSEKASSVISTAKNIGGTVKAKTSNFLGNAWKKIWG